MSTHLSNLAYWTGGTLLMASTPAHASFAARTIITELRHRIFSRSKRRRSRGDIPSKYGRARKNVTIRARSGYFAAGAEPLLPSSWSSDLRSTRTGSR